MNIGGIGDVWRFITRRKSRVTKPAAVDSEGVMSGEENETREHSDYSEKKKAEASTHFVYGPDGEKKPLDDDDPHEKLDVDA